LTGPVRITAAAAPHPLNAKLIAAEALGEAARRPGGGVEIADPCEAELPEGARRGELTVNARLRVRAHPSHGEVVAASLLGEDGAELARKALAVSELGARGAQQGGRRDGPWIDLAVDLAGGAAAAVRLAPAAGAVIELDRIEVFPTRLRLAIAPGSGVASDGDAISFELPRGRELQRLDADGLELTLHLDRLLGDGLATRTHTAFSTIIEMKLGDLLPDRGDVTELRARGAGGVARVQLRRAPAPERYEGDPAGARVLVTGFQPFPPDCHHDNVSEIAIGALAPRALRGARVMRLVLPVEYDRAAAALVEVIGRCRPDVVIGFGQGGDAIALEEIAYNLQDGGELAHGRPDNRGAIRAAARIDPDAPIARDTRLPLAAIEAALAAIGEAPRRSRDPGRYICNNVMFASLGTAAPRAGFIHLPCTTSFDPAARARFGRIVQAAVQATIDARPGAA
jgi:pyroglutamyl-peptidase